VRNAFLFALLYNLSVIAISLYGQMNPLLAAILMPLSSLVSLAIVALSLRNRRSLIEKSQRPPYNAADATHGNFATADSVP
jgi:Cu2+-exporting ATPase